MVVHDRAHVFIVAKRFHIYATPYAHSEGAQSWQKYIAQTLHASEGGWKGARTLDGRGSSTGFLHYNGISQMHNFQNV